jgi:ferredoxin
MDKEITLSIDGREVHSPEGAWIIEAADAAGIYIPRLCHHPDLAPGPGTKADSRIYRCGESIVDHGSGGKTYGGCNICVVGIKGKGIHPSCSTPVSDGMVITTNTGELREMRRDNLAELLALHPHACILCAERDGCDREECTLGVERNCRCCQKFDDCEFRAVSEYATIKEDVSQYVFKNIPVVDTPFFTFNANLCIGCTRCVRACEKMHGKRVIGFAFHYGTVAVGTIAPSHRESGCVFCGACVTVCPTGALMDKGLAWKKKAELKLIPVVLPPEDERELTEDNIKAVPDISGVYELLDEKRQVLYIRGADNIRSDLRTKWKTVDNARYFRYEEHGMYTMRENEMVEKFLKKYGRLPEVNNEIADLY